LSVRPGAWADGSGPCQRLPSAVVAWATGGGGRPVPTEAGRRLPGPRYTRAQTPRAEGGAGQPLVEPRAGASGPRAGRPTLAVHAPTLPRVWAGGGSAADGPDGAVAPGGAQACVPFGPRVGPCGEAVSTAQVRRLCGRPSGLAGRGGGPESWGVRGRGSLRGVEADGRPEAVASGGRGGPRRWGRIAQPGLAGDGRQRERRRSGRCLPRLKPSVGLCEKSPDQNMSQVGRRMETVPGREGG
jgi:hypothetical protein